MQPVILFRKTIDSEKEYEVAKSILKPDQLFTQRSQIPEDSIVIGRYSTLPFYRELEKDLIYQNSKLINSFSEHEFISEFGYYEYVQDYTPKTWFNIDFVPENEGPFVVKGRTNSKKHKWLTHMFCQNKTGARHIINLLDEDPLIRGQDKVIRKYTPLKKLGEDQISGIPYVNEWRFFLIKNIIMDYGYYWSSAPDEVINKASMTMNGLEFAYKLADIVKEYTNFFVLDIAETENPDEWILIEINDGQMSGLSEIPPDRFYRALDYWMNKGKFLFDKNPNPIIRNPNKETNVEPDQDEKDKQLMINARCNAELNDAIADAYLALEEVDTYDLYSNDEKSVEEFKALVKVHDEAVAKVIAIAKSYN